MPLATVSRKIGELEAHLGARLLVRTTRKLALTDAGAAYVGGGAAHPGRGGGGGTDRGGRVPGAARGAGVDGAGAVRAAAHPAGRGGVPGAYPEIRVRLRFSDRNLHLVDEHVDMAVRIGALPDSSMIATRVGVDAGGRVR